MSRHKQGVKLEATEFAVNYLRDSFAVREAITRESEYVETVGRISNLVCDAYVRGGKLLIAGNGGSAADAQHIAAEFVSRFFFDRPGLPAIALTTDTSMLTAIGNDYGFECLFSRQVEAQAVAGDVFIAISTSGNSKNILKAVDCARSMGVVTVGFCGSGGELRDKVDECFAVPSACTPYIQECHIVIGHIICAFVEQKIFSRSE